VVTSESFKTGTPDKELVGWCTIARFARAAARFEEILGVPSSGYDVRYDELREQIRARFAHDDGSWGDGTQTGLAFTADLGLADEQALADRLAAQMAEEVGVLPTASSARRWPSTCSTVRDTPTWWRRGSRAIRRPAIRTC
jgi:alpha-L-rhamnosidase